MLHNRCSMLIQHLSERERTVKKGFMPPFLHMGFNATEQLQGDNLLFTIQFPGYWINSGDNYQAT